MAQSKSYSKKSTSKKKIPSSSLRSSVDLQQKVSSKRNVLGRGLKALLSDSESSNVSSLSTSKGIEEISISSISANPYQPRTEFDNKALKELAQSIRTYGIIQPITIRTLSEGRYQIISGERRLQACKSIGLKELPAFVRKAEKGEMLEMALIENIQRESLNAIEISLSYQRLISECNLKQEDLARRVGKERSTVTNYLRLLRLPPAVQAALRDRQISMGHARSLLSVEDSDAQLLLLQKIQTNELSVRQTEAAARKLSQRVSTPKSTSSVSSKSYQYLQEELSSYLGTKVRLRATKNTQGEIHITYFSEDDLNRILDLIRS